MAKLLPAAWDIPAPIRARLGREAGRQRAMLHEGHLLLVTHALPDARQIARKAAFFWRKPDGSWKAAGEASGGFGGLGALVEAYRARVGALEDEVEGATRAADFHRVIHATAPLARSARNLHKTLQEARDMVPADAGLIAMRDLAYEVERTAELVALEAKAGLDFVVANRAEAQVEHAAHIDRSNHRLNLVVALFLPITALSGMLGMNLPTGLERHPWAFWAAVAGSFAVGFFLRARIDRRGD
jgi:hypothetical protein